MANTKNTNTATLLQALRAGSPRKLELLTADLMGRLLKVRVSTAKGGGFQHGGDAGTSGRAGRHLRLECKRYADTTPLSDRELQGEVDDALRRDPALELWVLVSTRSVSENTQDTLGLKAREVGVPILVVDWTLSRDALPDLASLCAWAPDLVEAHHGTTAASAARALSSFAQPAVDRIRHELQPWRIGYKQLRVAAAQRVLGIWNSPADSEAALAQNAAGGAASHLVVREGTFKSLQAWWRSRSTSPAVAYGAEGVGKTWAVLQWVIRTLHRLPITLTLPASGFADVKAHSEVGVLQFLAGALFEVVKTQDRAFWEVRLNRLLSSPASDPVVMVLLIDGLNQEPSFDWLRVVQILQGGIFRGRVRLILTTQSNYLEQRLHGLRISGGVTKIGVEPYDVAPGGELDQMLAHHGRTKESLPEELVHLARVPRLLPLALKLSSNVDAEGGATLTRLLWAYGRDDLGQRTGRAFGETDWEAWLYQLAGSLWAEIQAGTSTVCSGRPYSLDDLDRMVSRQSLAPSLNYRRLSEIIDGTWMEPAPHRPGSFRPKESTIHLALGATVLRMLEEASGAGAESVDAALTRWLDPIAATSAASDILAAAMSIAVAKGLPVDSTVGNVIVMALLRSQNVQDGHRMQVGTLAPLLVSPLLHAAEKSGSRALASSRQWALTSLAAIPSSNARAWDEITERLVAWVARVPCPDDSPAAERGSYEEHQTKRLMDRIGVVQPGTHEVMGVPVQLVPGEFDDLGQNVPGLLLGKPLANARRLFAAAAVTAAMNLRTQAWEGLKWLVALNPADGTETVAELVRLADAAFAVAPMNGVHPELPNRVGALLLWLTGVDVHERRAATVRVSFEPALDYEADYLPTPTRSWFGIERRHLNMLWDDAGIPVLSRIRKARKYLADPSVTASDSFVRLVQVATDEFDVSKLDTSFGLTSEDLALQDLLPGAARLVPASAATLASRWFSELKRRSGEQRHWSGLRSTRYLILSDAQAAHAARHLRQSPPDPAHEHEPYIAMQLLMVELLGQPLDSQLDTLVEALRLRLSLNLLQVLSPPDAGAMDRFFTRWGRSDDRALEVAFSYMAEHAVEVDSDLFSALAQVSVGDDPKLRTLAFIGLHRANPIKFGEFLLRSNWRTTSEQTVFEQEHGSRALLAASEETPLEDLQFVVAPWCLLSEARRRGGGADDAKVAASALGAALGVDSMAVAHSNVGISIELTRHRGLISFEPVARRSGDGEGASLWEDFDEQETRRKQARASGHDYLKRSRDAGAVLAVTLIDVDDARMLVAQCSAEIDVWLAGCEQRSPAFRGRVNVAGGLFLSLCEALLESDWTRGVALWHAIDECLRTSFSGLGGINDLMHMPFRVEDNPGTLLLREYLYSLDHGATDRHYFDLAICAEANGRLDWLRQRIRYDEKSGNPLRGRRAAFLNGLVAEIDVSAATWPEGMSVGVLEGLRRQGQAWTNNIAFAKYWWREFVAAGTPAAAFSAWENLLLCADRRVLAWMKRNPALFGRDDPLALAKLAHVDANWSKLMNAMREQETKGVSDMGRNLFGWTAPEHWFETQQLAGLCTDTQRAGTCRGG